MARRSCGKQGHAVGEEYPKRTGSHLRDPEERDGGTYLMASHQVYENLGESLLDLARHHTASAILPLDLRKFLIILEEEAKVLVRDVILRIGA